MKVTDFIGTVEWMDETMPNDTKAVLFDAGFYNAVAHGGDGVDVDELLKAAVKISDGLAVWRSRVEQHPFVKVILHEFNLDMLLDPDFGHYLVRLVNKRKESTREEADLLWSSIRSWKTLRQTVEHVKALLLPKAIAEETPFDDILTIETNFEEGVYPQPKFIRTILENVEQLYASVSTALGKKKYSPLTVIFIATGTSIRFDFKGLGEPIKEIKGLLVEVWTRIRHRKADDTNQNNAAVLGSLNVIKEIEKCRENGSLPHEDANRLREQIFRNAMDLFDAGTSIREIPNEEAISNRDLLQAKQVKLLPASTTDVKKDNTSTRKKPGGRKKLGRTSNARTAKRKHSS